MRFTRERVIPIPTTGEDEWANCDRCGEESCVFEWSPLQREPGWTSITVPPGWLVVLTKTLATLDVDDFDSDDFRQEMDETLRYICPKCVAETGLGELKSSARATAKAPA